MSRLDDLNKLLGNVKDEEIKILIKPSLEQVVYLENQLETIKTYPFIKFHPKDPTKQKILPAQRVYISLLQQYNLLIKTLCKIMNANGDTELSPLRAYLESLKRDSY